MIQNLQSQRTFFHTQDYLKEGVNYCHQKYEYNRNYFIVGTKKILRAEYNLNDSALQPVKIYFDDIIAILDNKCLAASKVYV